MVARILRSADAKVCLGGAQVTDDSPLASQCLTYFTTMPCSSHSESMKYHKQCKALGKHKCASFCFKADTGCALVARGMLLSECGQLEPATACQSVSDRIEAHASLDKLSLPFASRLTKPTSHKSTTASRFSTYRTQNASLCPTASYARCTEHTQAL